MSDPLTLIRARKQEIVAEITRLSAQLDALRAELPDLEAAERVLSRFSGGAGTPYSTTQQPAPTPEPEAGTSKPPNTPTISDMILEALRDAKSKGLAGLQPHGMTSVYRPKVVAERSRRRYQSDRVANGQAGRPKKGWPPLHAPQEYRSRRRPFERTSAASYFNST